MRRVSSNRGHLGRNHLARTILTLFTPWNTDTSVFEYHRL